MANFPARLLRNWDILERPSVRAPSSGAMNETWLLEWPGQRCVLRRHRRLVRDEVEFEHRVLAHAGSGGIPCPAIIPARGGAALVEDDARFYSLYSWAPGSQIFRGHLDPQHARSMGSMLGRIHKVLADLPGGPQAHDRESPLDETLGRIEELNRIAHDCADRARVGWAIDELTARARWLADHKPGPPAKTTAASQVIHGDYQESNLFFEAGEVSCVIDWDKARREVPSREVVRAMDYALGMEPLLCRQFLSGYRSVATITPGQLEEAAGWFSYQDAHDLWVVEQFLLHDNDRVEGLADHKPFVPFLPRWTAAELT
ncbi:MAG TPA: phosphotransferase [Acidimicrobiales bacterium]|nr:phosphotransferase [Acidimicrobiales bacterium]